MINVCCKDSHEAMHRSEHTLMSVNTSAHCLVTQYMPKPWQPKPRLGRRSLGSLGVRQTAGS